MDIQRKTVQRILLGLVLVSGIIVFRLFHLEQYLTLEALKAHQASFASLYAAHRLLIPAAYLLLYVLVTALSLPGAAIMTLAGGALFGLLPGTVLVSFASSIGATLACAASRYLFRDWVQNRFGDRLDKINQGMLREGGFYLFSLRLVPVFPFFVINLVMGLTPIRLTTFYWVSQLGMLPATVVYVNAGTRLAGIASLQDIFSPSLIGSFVLLGLLPILSKTLLNLYRKSRGNP